MTQKKLNKRIDEIWEYCGDGAKYVDESNNLATIIGFADTLTMVYEEIEEIMDAFTNYYDKQRAHRIQIAINELIVACEATMSDTGAFD